MDLFFIFGAKYLFILSPIIALIIYWKTPRPLKKQLVVFGLISLIVCFVVARLAGTIYYHSQPFALEHFAPLVPHAVDNAFPSDHTLITAALAGIIYFYNRRAGLWLWLVAIVVGLSRMYVGLHYGMDIIASLLIAAIVTTLLFHLVQRFPKHT